jgi:hypothetical protein
MARKRMIHPSLLTSRDVRSLPIPSRLGWVALLLNLDDYGRTEDDDAILFSQCWPGESGYTRKKCAADLDRYEERGMICRFQDDSGRRYLHVPSWTRFQQVSHKGAPSTPPCPYCDLGVSRESLRKDSGSRPEAFRRNVVEVSRGQSREVEPSRSQVRLASA